MTTGQWVLVVAVVLAVGFGVWRAWSDGRFRGTHAVRGAGRLPLPAEVHQAQGSLGDGAIPMPSVATDPVVSGADDVTSQAAPHATSLLAETPYADRLGERATLLQFSSAFCAPCRATRRILEDVASVVPGVVHVEVDAEESLELVRRLGVMRTPTTLVLDEAGREVTRATGAPSKPQVLHALNEVFQD